MTTPPILLSDDECETLERWARQPTSNQALPLRCWIVLDYAQELSNVEAARQLGVQERRLASGAPGSWRADSTA
jgi:hypothetical protein